MKEGWKYESFGNVFPIRMGKTPPRADKEMWDANKETKNLWVSVADITSNEGQDIISAKEHISELAAKKMRIVPRGYLLMSFKLTIGKMAFAGKDLYTNEAIIAIPKNEKYDLRFLYYYLSSYNWDTLTKGAEKVKGKTLNKSSIGKIQLPIIPLPEQERIVSLLDLEFAKIDAIKANAEKQLQDAKDLFQSALKDLLTPKEGWKIRKFGDVCEYYKEQGKWVNINYIGLENIDAHTGKLIDYKSSNEVESSTFKFNKGDVLYGRLRPYLQKVIIASFDGCCSTEIFPIKSNVVNNVYLKFWLLSDAVTDIMNESCSGCRMPRANMNSFKEEYIQYPSEQEQIIIANKLVDLQNMIGEIQFNYEQTITLCNDLKQSILKDIFG